jgi:hypothetical protein
VRGGGWCDWGEGTTLLYSWCPVAVTVYQTSSKESRRKKESLPNQRVFEDTFSCISRGVWLRRNAQKGEREKNLLNKKKSDTRKRKGKNKKQNFFLSDTLSN